MAARLSHGAIFDNRPSHFTHEWVESTAMNTTQQDRFAADGALNACLKNRWGHVSAGLESRLETGLAFHRLQPGLHTRLVRRALNSGPGSRGDSAPAEPKAILQGRIGFEAMRNSALVPKHVAGFFCSFVCFAYFAVTAFAAPAAPGPIDCRHRIPASAFTETSLGEWVSEPVRPAFPFDELIYSWHLNQAGDTFRLYLKAVFGPGDETDWLYAGCWGDVMNRVENRERPAFDRGMLDMDWLKLKTNATAFRFKVVAAGTEPLSAPPELTVIATDNHPSAERTNPPAISNDESRMTNGMMALRLKGRVLDIPLRRQIDSSGKRLKDRCQSAALASAMEYFGKSVPLEDVVRLTYDPEYRYPGIWPRVIAAAQEFGFDGYIDRFRDWTAVRRALAENKVLLCSIRLEEGQCEVPPYPEMGDHIVALCGVTDDGRVVVTDSFLGKSGKGYLCQWLQRDFEVVWMRTKGGIAMAICPPDGATPRYVSDLPQFPKDRTFPAGDDH
jgi:hypothetical protein